MFSGESNDVITIKKIFLTHKQKLTLYIRSKTNKHFHYTHISLILLFRLSLSFHLFLFHLIKNFLHQPQVIGDQHLHESFLFFHADVLVVGFECLLELWVGDVVDLEELGEFWFELGVLLDQDEEGLVDCLD